MPDKQSHRCRQGNVGPANQQARYDNHSGSKARDRLRARLEQKQAASDPTDAEVKEEVDDWRARYGEQGAEAITKMLLGAWSSPKWKEAEAAAIKIRDRTDLDSCEKGYLQAKLLEWAASP